MHWGPWLKVDIPSKNQGYLLKTFLNKKFPWQPIACWNLVTQTPDKVLKYVLPINAPERLFIIKFGYFIYIFLVFLLLPLSKQYLSVTTARFLKYIWPFYNNIKSYRKTLLLEYSAVSWCLDKLLTLCITQYQKYWYTAAKRFFLKVKIKRLLCLLYIKISDQTKKFLEHL